MEPKGIVSRSETEVQNSEGQTGVICVDSNCQRLERLKKNAERNEYSFVRQHFGFSKRYITRDGKVRDGKMRDGKMRDGKMRDGKTSDGKAHVRKAGAKPSSQEKRPS